MSWKAYGFWLTEQLLIFAIRVRLVYVVSQQSILIIETKNQFLVKGVFYRLRAVERSSHKTAQWKHFCENKRYW